MKTSRNFFAGVLNKTAKIVKGKTVLLFSLLLLSVSMISLIRAGGSAAVYFEENDFIRILRNKLAAFKDHLPEDRVYLQFDKPFYKPGETIWFSAYVREGQTFMPSSKSEILHVQLISPKGNVEKSIRIISKGGKAAGDFTIGEEKPGGIYKVKAFTNWQKNETDTMFFEKEFQVQSVVLPNLKMKLDFERKAFGAGDEVVARVELNSNENQPLSNYHFKYVAQLEGKKFVEQAAVTGNAGMMYIRFRLPEHLKTSDGLLNVLVDYQGQTESVSRSIPIVLNRISFSLYPEGGDLVSGLESRVAFKAVNEFGKPADVEGIIMDSNGDKAGEFVSFHQGMGAFTFKPEAGERYTVKITKPAGVKETFPLPEALPRGYVMHASPSNPGEISLTLRSTETERVTVVAQVRGKMCYALTADVSPAGNKLLIPTAGFPIGVAQFTLFDQKGIERAERLVFVNKITQLSVSIETDKEKYLPREKVKMTLHVKDERGMPMPASFSLAVANDQLLSFADDRSGNILSKLLLEYDLKTKVEEPSFYFDRKEPKADQALDYLLLTAGYRRFEWKKMLEEDLPMITYQGEKAIISGSVIDYYSGKPVEKATVRVNESLEVQTNDKGEFLIKNIELTQPARLMISASGFGQQQRQVNDYGQNQKYYLYSTERLGYKRGIYDVAGEPLVPQAFPAEAAGERGVKMEARREMEAVFNVEKKTKAAPEMEMKKDVLVRDKAIAVADTARPERNNREPVQGKVADDRAVRGEIKKPAVNNQTLYYRARVFEAPVYDKTQKVEYRNDFRSTVYWNPMVEVDRTGKKEIEFYNTDEITSFRITAEGISADGMIGRAEKTIYTQLPFAMSVKAPAEVATGDMVSIPLTLRNNTSANIMGVLNVTEPGAFKSMTPVSATQVIPAGQTRLIYLDYRVTHAPGDGELKVAFTSAGQEDGFVKHIRIVPKGFPVTASFSGNEGEKTYSVNMENVVEGSVRVQLTAYPSVVSDLVKGVEGILREPHGCFEQTSATSYPNVLVMDYLKTAGIKDEKILSRAEQLLDKGYKRLVTFETRDKGYEWFGAAPGHEGLTAYGMMQFNDMTSVYPVDRQMIKRTGAWLLSRRDGNGGFKRNERALDNFGRASDDITNAYIVYALAESGMEGIEKEIERSCSKAMDSKDAYQLGLAANALFKTGDEKRGMKAMEKLYSMQEKNGSWSGASHSITRSTGQSLTIETTGLAILAMLKSGAPDMEALTKAVDFLVKSRNGYGYFGSTQATIMALKSLTGYAKFSKKVAEDGVLEFYVDGRKVAEKAYRGGQTEAVALDDLSQYVKPGKRDFKVKFRDTRNPMPYSLAVTWNTFLPSSDKQCVVSLDTKLSARAVAAGETARLTAVLKNTTGEGIPSTMAIIGIPAGLSVQPWQLKELQEKKTFDYYEVNGNNVILYYRQMAPSEIKTIHFDLKAEVPGEFDAPASCAYLYYTSEYKYWTGMDRIRVMKKA